MTYGIGVLFRIGHECFVTPEGAAVGKQWAKLLVEMRKK